MPIVEARIPATHFAYRWTDVSNDVVGVLEGTFSRLNDHVCHFRASMERLRMVPEQSQDDIRHTS